MTRAVFSSNAGAGVAARAVPDSRAGCPPPDAPPLPATAPLPANPFLAWFGIDLPMMQRLLGALGSGGADAGELFFQHTRTSVLTLEDGAVNRAYSAIDQGVGLRVVAGDQVGYAFTEDLSEGAMRQAARTAAAIAHRAAVPPTASVNQRAAGSHYRLAVPWELVRTEEKLPLLRRVDALARARDARVQKVSVSLHDSEDRILIATLDGRLLIDERPLTKMHCSVSAKRASETQTAYASISSRRGLDWYAEERLTALANLAVDRAIVLFDAQKAPAGELPVVLAAGASGMLLHEAIGHGMEADFNRKNVSIYSEMLGKPVAPSFVTIVDDGTIDGETGTLNFDDEGNPCEQTLLVENGILATYLHDGISSRHYRVPATGSGRRESYKYPPMPRMRSTYMRGGPHSRDEIIASVSKGIIAETFTNGQVHIGAGDFTFYVKNGWLIENGKVTAPIRDANLVGNGPEVLRRVAMAADDVTLDPSGWMCGKYGQAVPVSLGMPTVLISRLTVGGENAPGS
ncbi:MAG: TldD/PmbA family protein [Candidatus Schekmanbacteria bacterium]|nr:TldD/PmbA family protein [Candidatus Schekmanbacteria bacterium]